MTTITLTAFFNPLGNGDSDITGLVAATYPLVLDAGNSYTYTFFPYALVYDVGLNNLIIVDTTGPTNTVFYSFNVGTNHWECYSDIYSRPSVLAPYFTVPTAPGIFVRPAVRATQIRYNWTTSPGSEYILTCTPTNGGSGGGTVVLPNNRPTYTFSNLTFGKTYEAGFNLSTVSGVSVSSFYRTVTTGDAPGTPINPSFVSTPTSMALSWDPPAGTQTPPIGWYVIKDGAVKYDTRLTSLTIPFDQTPHNYTVQSVADTGYSTGLSTIIS